VVSLSASTFRKIVLSEPTVAESALKHFGMEIRALTTRVYEFSTLAVRYRIQAEVWRLASLSTRHGKIAKIAPAPMHAENASRTIRTARLSHASSIALPKLEFLSNETASSGSPISTGWRHWFTTSPANRILLFTTLDLDQAARTACVRPAITNITALLFLARLPSQFLAD
jgi:hypothetical protein